MVILVNKRHKTKRPYVDVNVPRDWEQYLEEAPKQPEIQKSLEIAGRDSKVSSLGVWIIEQWLINNTGYRFEHFNTYEDHATIKDKKFPNQLFDIYPKPSGELWCETCDSIECEHIKFALTVHEITEPLQKKGWKHRDRVKVKVE